jgi:hypothetical protein
MWNPFFNKTVKIKESIEAHFKTEEEKFENAILSDNVELASAYIYNDKNEIIVDLHNLLRKLYKNDSINIFTFIIQNTLMNTSIQNCYAFFLTDIMCDEPKKCIPFLSITFTDNSKILGKHGGIKPRFSESFFEATIKYNKIEIFEHLMSLEHTFELNTRLLFEEARVENETFLIHLFKYPKLVKRFKEKNIEVFNEFPIYTQYCLNSKLSAF